MYTTYFQRFELRKVCCHCLFQQRLKTDEYEDIETFSTDMYLLFDNAIKFYQPDLQEHKDAVKLKELFEDAKARLCKQIDEQGKLFGAGSNLLIKCYLPLKCQLKVVDFTKPTASSRVCSDTFLGF